tara:strand:- start:2477 stop:2974 length:498 start_codon:yes stop_codon:yes gene_type:complete
MSITALTTFVTIEEYVTIGPTALRFQNSTKSSITYDIDGDGPKDAESYTFLPFIYQGATKTRDGSNMEAALVLANNKITMNRLIHAVKNKWTIKVDVCLMEPDTFVYKKTLSRDVWIASSMSYDPETIELVLSSAVDAVGANCPNRKLTEQMVGALPTSADIRNI